MANLWVFGDALYVVGGRRSSVERQAGIRSLTWASNCLWVKPGLIHDD